MVQWLAMRKEFPGLPGQEFHVVNVLDESLVVALTAHGFKVYVIEGSKIVNERTFFEEAARVFEFPDYFGYGWASWDDCLGDFGHLAPARVAIIWKDADQTFAAVPQTFLQAVCDLHSLMFSVSIHATRHPEEGIEPKQIELFFLGQGKGFAKLELTR
jgi:RNAse (barnase) inhibitor barstar